EQDKAYATLLDASRMAEQLAAGSDRLTTAVRAYASTGEQRYLDDFERELKVDRTRDKAVERLNQIGLTTSELDLLTEAKKNSDSLVSLENRAFEAAGKKDFTTAIGFVYGDEYRKAKASIMQPISRCRDMLERRLTREAATLAARAKLLTNIGLAVMFANVAAIIGALIYFYGKRVVNPLAALNESLHGLLARKAGVTIGHQQDESEIGEIARSLESYRCAVNEIESQRQTKTIIADIASSLQTAETAEAFAQALMSRLVPALQGGCGALFLLHEPTQCFELAGGYSYQKRPDLSTSFPMGKGMVGQCGKERRPIILTDVPADYIKIVSGIGEATPRIIVLVPLLSREQLLGVLELASFTPLTDATNALLNEVANIAAINLQLLLRNLKTREMLAQARNTEPRTT
ncbi:MAG TPA: GAF domain-containing protein, partial [Candidatus Dormibacteraeota bacterium]|nr:GAF domain-containing protein [Candidatus Dormibacteraeota bacterium]